MLLHFLASTQLLLGAQQWRPLLSSASGHGREAAVTTAEPEKASDAKTVRCFGTTVINESVHNSGLVQSNHDEKKQQNFLNFSRLDLNVFVC